MPHQVSLSFCSFEQWEASTTCTVSAHASFLHSPLSLQSRRSRLLGLAFAFGGSLLPIHRAVAQKDALSEVMPHLNSLNGFLRRLP